MFVVGVGAGMSGSAASPVVSIQGALFNLRIHCTAQNLKTLVRYSATECLKITKEFDKIQKQDSPDSAINLKRVKFVGGWELSAILFNIGPRKHFKFKSVDRKIFQVDMTQVF